MTEKTELETLKEELEKLSYAIYCKEMSDDYCYSNGTIYPMLHREKELKAKIAELEKVSE